MFREYLIINLTEAVSPKRTLKNLKKWGKVLWNWLFLKVERQQLLKKSTHQLAPR